MHKNMHTHARYSTALTSGHIICWSLQMFMHADPACTLELVRDSQSDLIRLL